MYTDPSKLTEPFGKSITSLPMHRLRCFGGVSSGLFKRLHSLRVVGHDNYLETDLCNEKKTAAW